MRRRVVGTAALFEILIGIACFGTGLAMADGTVLRLGLLGLLLIGIIPVTVVYGRPGVRHPRPGVAVLWLILIWLVVIVAVVVIDNVSTAAAVTTGVGAFLAFLGVCSLLYLDASPRLDRN